MTTTNAALAAVTSLNTTKYDWGNALKVEVGDLTKATGGNAGNSKASTGPLPIGRYAAFLQEVKHGTFKTGSYGLTFKFVIEGGASKNRKISECVVLTNASGNPTPFGAERMKRRLMNFGMPIEKINAFKGPRNEHDLGDFKLVLGAPVTLVIKEDKPYNGKAATRISAVYPREIAE